MVGNANNSSENNIVRPIRGNNRMIVIQVCLEFTVPSCHLPNVIEDKIPLAKRERERERLQAVLSGKPVSYRFDRPSENFHVFRWRCQMDLSGLWYDVYPRGNTLTSVAIGKSIRDD